MLAIVIPYYKISYFDATLKSLSNQTDQRFKVYIGDDASPEKPNLLLEKYHHKFDFVYHRFEENLGGESLTMHWERCIELTANEPWIMILGDDDILSENVIECFYKNLPEIENSKSNLIRFATKSIDNVRNFVSKIYTNPILENASDSFYRKCLGQTRSSLSEYLFKRDIYLKYGFKNFPLAWHTDDFAWLEFSEHAPIYSINNAVISITVSNDSLSGKKHNLIEKNNAEILFYKDLIQNKLNLFRSNQKNSILIELELAIKKFRKMTFAECRYISWLYLSNYLFFQFLKFIRRSIKVFQDKNHIT